MAKGKGKEIRIKIVGDSRNAEQALESVSNKAGRLSKVFKVGLAAAGAAVAGLTAVMKESIEAAAEEERAIAMLSQAMQQHGTYSAEALEGLKKFASEQQKLTTFADDATLAAMHQLQTFGMSTETMKEATKAAQDLAAAKGIDLATAANLVGRAYAGNTGMLSRYGIVLDEARLQAEGFNYVLEALNQQFGGAAQAAADTYTGRMEQMKNAIGDLKETIGYAVLPALKTMAESLRDTFAGLQESGALQAILEPLSQAFSRLAPLVGDALVSVVDVITKSGVLESITNLFASLLEVLVPLFEQLGPPLTKIFAALVDIGSQILSAIAPVIEALAPILVKLADHVARFLNKAAPIIGEIATKLSEILVKILNKMEPHIDRILEAVFSILEMLLPLLPPLIDLLTPILDIITALAEPLVAVVWWVGKIAEVITGTLKGAIEFLLGAIQGLGDAWSVVWNGIKSTFEAAWKGIIWIKDNVAMPVLRFFEKMWDGLAVLWSRAFGVLKSVLKPIAKGFLSVVKAFATAYDYTLNFDADVAPKVDEAIAKVNAWHKGGPIPKNLGEVLLPLGLFKGGEWVIQERAVRVIGEENMALINQGKLPSSGVSVNINFHGPVISDDRSWEAMARKIQYVYAPRIARAMGATP